MPLQKGVGFSRWTRVKLKQLRAIMTMHVKITKAVLTKHRFYEQTYHFIDATAGPGTYEVNGEEVQGSPLVFLSVAEEQQLMYKAELIEKEPENQGYGHQDTQYDQDLRNQGRSEDVEWFDFEKRPNSSGIRTIGQKDGPFDDGSCGNGNQHVSCF